MMKWANSNDEWAKISKIRTLNILQVQKDVYKLLQKWQIIYFLEFLPNDESTS